MIFSIIALGFSEPQNHLWLTGACSFFVCFFAATQDSIIDSMRIDLLTDADSGAGAAMESVGFRLGMLTSGAGTLYLAALVGWSWAYFAMGCLCFVGVLTFLYIPEQTKRIPNQEITSLYKAFRHSYQHLSHTHFFLFLCLFIFCFKGADTVLNAMSAPFFCDLGFTKIEYANVSKFFGIAMMLGGGLCGGWLIHHMGLRQTVIMGTLLQCVSSLLFVVQGLVGHNVQVLMVTVGVESFCSGLCSTAFIAYLSFFCKSSFAASHFTILYALGSFSRVLVSMGAGWIANTFGWIFLFLLSSLFTIPVFYALMRIHEKNITSSE
jgi:PAT family beta-lactamase induction signal transducer AmpG